MLKLITLVAALTLVLMQSSFAKEAIDPSPFGICALGIMHGGTKQPFPWTSQEANVRRLKDAGIYWDRLEIWWGAVEPQKGQFEWAFPDQVAQFYREQKLNGMVILCYSSAWYRKPPDTPEERAAYANYVYQMVNRYKDTFKVWEIWNEPNIESFWKPSNVRDYTLMLIEAYKAAKKADPDCIILGGAVNGPGYDFVQGIYDNGGWDYCDAISIHPYSLGGPPLSQRLDRWLRFQNSEIAKTGKPKPVWVSECGYASVKPEEEPGQATAIVQAYLIALANGVQKYFYFNYGNYSNWGLIRTNDPWTPKVSYGAYKLMTQALGSPGPCAEFEGYLDLPRNVAGYVFRKAGGDRVVFLWSNDDQVHSTQLRQAVGLKAVDIAGKPVSIDNGALSVGPLPIIVTGVDSRKIGPVGKQFNPYLEAKGQNLLLNPSFESGGDHADYWNIGRFYSRDKDGTFAWTNDGRDGSKCISVSQSGDVCACDSYPVPAAPGQKYRLTGWIKTKDATGANVIGIFWYNGNQWHIVPPTIKTPTITGTNDWREFTIEGTAPKGTSQVRVNLTSENNKGTVWFDDMKLEQE